MGKSKSKEPSEARKVSKYTSVTDLSSVKHGAITKPSDMPKVKSKELAKQAAKAQDADLKKKKKSQSSDSEESEEDSDDDDSSDSSDSDSESEAEVSKKAVASNGVKTNGVAKSDPQESSGTSDSSESSESDSSESESDSEKKENNAGSAAVGAGASNIASKFRKTLDDQNESDSDSGSDSASDSGSESDDTTGRKTNVLAKKVGKVTNGDKTGGSSSSSESESDSDSGDSSDSESETEAPPKKRKAEEEEVSAPKKFKTEDVDDASKRNLFVGRLSFNVDDEWLGRTFEQYGEVSRAQVMVDKTSGRSRGFGYVEFTNAADGERAQKEMNGQEIDGRPVNIDFSKPKAPAQSRDDRAKQYGDHTLSPPSSTLFVANIAFAATSDVIGDEFGKHGEVMGVRLPTDKDTGNPKGFGYVEFSNIDEAQKAFKAMSGKPIMGRVPRLDYSSPRPDRDSFGGGGGGGGRGGSRGGFGGRGRGGRGGGGGNTNRGGFGDFQGKKKTFS